MNQSFMKTLLIAGVPFGIIMGLLFWIMQGSFIGFFLGLSAGLLFGLALAIFVQVQSQKFKKIGLVVTQGKPIIADGGANHYRGMEAVGGWLYLTADELIFKSHAYNAQAHQSSILLKQITDLKTGSNLGIPNGLHIILQDGTVEKFVVTGPKLWIEKITGAMASSTR